MQLPALLMKAPAHTHTTASATTSVDLPLATAAPMLMLLDITADAPVIIMPGGNAGNFRVV